MTAPAEADIPAASRPAIDAAAHQLGFVPNMYHALAATPKALNAWLDLRKAMSTSLDAATRQGIAHAVDEINGCDYCDAMHTWVSQQITRLDDDEIARNRGGSSNDTRRAAAVAFAREVALTRGKVRLRAGRGARRRLHRRPDPPNRRRGRAVHDEQLLQQCDENRYRRLP
jgi:alkylhydroperoxidase family enzyme